MLAVGVTIVTNMNSNQCNVLVHSVLHNEHVISFDFPPSIVNATDFQCLSMIILCWPQPTTIIYVKAGETRMHSSRMRTARLLPVSPSMHCSGRSCLVLGRGVPAWVPGGYLPGPGGCTWSRGCTCPVLGVYLPGPGGVPDWSGGCTCLINWGVYLPGPGGCTCLVPRGCTCLVQGGDGACSGECIWSGGYLPGTRGYLPGPGVPGLGVWNCLVWGGWGYLPGPRGCTCPGTPPVDRILDTRFWKYYLAPNFICGGKISVINLSQVTDQMNKHYSKMFYVLDTCNIHWVHCFWN